jgi:CHAT domain-containing protein
MLVLSQGSSVKLVVLSACETAAHAESRAIMGVAPRLVWAGIPAVVAMQFAVPDKTAVALMRFFYESLADGKPLDTAMTVARRGAYFVYDDKIFWAIPVLFMRAPNGVIWQ